MCSGDPDQRGAQHADPHGGRVSHRPEDDEHGQQVGHSDDGDDSDDDDDDAVPRAPRLLLPAEPAGQTGPAAAAGQLHGQHADFPDFADCDCHFGENIRIYPPLL